MKASRTKVRIDEPLVPVRLDIPDGGGVLEFDLLAGPGPTTVVVADAGRFAWVWSLIEEGGEALGALRRLAVLQHLRRRTDPSFDGLWAIDHLLTTAALAAIDKEAVFPVGFDALRASETMLALLQHAPPRLRRALIELSKNVCGDPRAPGWLEHEVDEVLRRPHGVVIDEPVLLGLSMPDFVLYPLDRSLLAQEALSAIPFDAGAVIEIEADPDPTLLARQVIVQFPVTRVVEIYLRLYHREIDGPISVSVCVPEHLEPPQGIGLITMTARMGIPPTIDQRFDGGSLWIELVSPTLEMPKALPAQRSLVDHQAGLLASLAEATRHVAVDRNGDRRVERLELLRRLAASHLKDGDGLRYNAVVRKLLEDGCEMFLADGALPGASAVEGELLRTLCRQLFG